ncbi:hypothetical protein SNE40_011421 [Patella caerulea]|uniref:Apple domain-containing protein n=1 Tax=Patella caerulea TaxID=87958 RepID=A0AAN8JIS2_PATCE
MFLALFVCFVFLESVRCEICAYNFDANRGNSERNTNNAYHKETFINKFSCGKYCTDHAECMGFNTYVQKSGTTCAFFNTFGTTAEMIDSKSVSYFERSCPGMFHVNSMQYYKDRKYLVLNGDDLVSTHKVTEISASVGVDATSEGTYSTEKYYDGWPRKIIPQASLNLHSLPGSPTLLFSGEKYKCFKRYSNNPYLEYCKESGSYSLMGDVIGTSGKPLDAAMADYMDSDAIYALSNDIVFYVKKSSPLNDPAVVYTAMEKNHLRDGNTPWSNLPDGLTALALVDTSTALVFVGKQYHIYDTSKKAVVKSGYMCVPDGGCPKRFKQPKPMPKETVKETTSGTDKEAAKRI